MAWRRWFLRLSWLGIAACISIGLLGPASFAAGEAPTGRPPKQRADDPPKVADETVLLVGFHRDANMALRTSVHAAAGTNRIRSFRHIPVEVVRVPTASALAAARAFYESRPEVAYVEPNYRYQASAIPNDPQFPILWGLHNTAQIGGVVDADIDAPEAWDVQTGSHDVIVAIIDTGIDYTHPDLVPNLWTNTAELNGLPGIDDDANGIVDDIYGARWNSGSGLPTNGDPMDGAGHGTHVAGTIGAAGNNGIGVVGVNHSVRLMGLKFLDDSGFGDTADAVAAIEYAIDQGAHLSNNSWGGGGFSNALRDAIAAAGAANQLFVAAAGNDASNTDTFVSYPSGYDLPNIISVASSTRSETLSSFSNFGATTVDLAAPGSDIYSTIPGGSYGWLSGTSMASPHVAGVAALLLAHSPGASPAEVKSWILDSADPVPAFSGLMVTGARLNAAAALALAASPTGRIVLDRPAYACLSLVTVRVIDSDLAGSSSITVQLTTSGGDSESLQLSAYSLYGFEMAIATSTGSAVAGDGELQVAHGQQITAAYQDADDGTGSPALVTTTAQVDCVPAQIQSIAITNLAGRRATVAVDTDEATTARVRFGTNCASLTRESVSTSPGTAHSVHLVNLASETPHFFAVDVYDLAGNLRTDDNLGACHSFTTPFAPDYFTEEFTQNDNDLASYSITFTPDGSADFYESCVEPATNFPTDPSGGTTLNMSDDSWTLVSPVGAQVHLYGASYSSFYVGSNGYLTFATGDSTFTESLSTHFAQPRISALFDDLDPSAGGIISWKQLADRVAVTYELVPEYASGNVNSFQVELFFDGRIRITYLELSALDGLAGLSQGLGVPDNFEESDLSAYAPCGATSPGSGVLYKHSLDANNQFDKYDIATNTWTPLNGYSSRLNMVSVGGVLYALSESTNMIQSYDPATDTWIDVLSGPNASLMPGNLERLPNGEFIAHAASSGNIHYTVGGAWTSVDLGFQPNAIGDFDPASNRLVVGEFETDRFHVIDVSSWAEVGQVALGGSNGETARAGAVLGSRFYTQYGFTNLLSFDIASVGDPQDHGGNTSYEFYDSIAADLSTGLIYVASLSGSSLKSWDSVGLSVTDLAGGFDNGNHSSLVWVPGTGPTPVPTATPSHTITPTPTGGTPTPTPTGGTSTPTATWSPTLPPSSGFVRVIDCAGGPGATASCSVQLELAPGVVVSTLQMNLSAAPSGGSPVLASAVSFAAGGSVGAPSFSIPDGNSTVLLGWLAGFNPVLSGTVSLGTLHVPVPAAAAAGHEYVLNVINPSATSDGSNDVLLDGLSGTLSIGVPYLVCDAAPLLGDQNGDGDSVDAGEFGNGVLNNADVVAIFRASLLPGELPPANSALFSAMDSVSEDAPPLCGGNGALANNDVVQCFRRSLLPGLTNFERIGEPGACTSSAIGAAASEAALRTTVAPRSVPRRAARAVAALSLGTVEYSEGELRVPLELRRLRPMRLATLQAAVDVAGSIRDLEEAGALAPPAIALHEKGALLVGWLAAHEPVLRRDAVLGTLILDGEFLEAEQRFSVRLTAASGMNDRGEELDLAGARGWLTSNLETADQLRWVRCEGKKRLAVGASIRCWAEGRGGARIDNVLWFADSPGSLSIEVGDDGSVLATALSQGRVRLYANQPGVARMPSARLLLQ